jgi:hypothetical protein
MPGTLLDNGDFSQGTRSWRPVANAASVTLDIATDSAGGGRRLLFTSTATPERGSFAQDFQVPVVNQTLGYNSLRAEAWVRADAAFSGIFTLWELSGGTFRSSDTPFTLGGGEGWVLIVTMLRLVAPFAHRVEIYSLSPSRTLGVQAVVVFGTS